MNLGHEAVQGLNYSAAVWQNFGVAGYLHNNVLQHPQRLAAVHDGKNYSYHELDLRARALAAELTRCGVQPGDRVGVFFCNHPDYIASFFAATGIGATVVPINPLLKSEEIAHILLDSNAKAVIAHESGREEITRAVPQLNNLSHVLIVSYGSPQSQDNVAAQVEFVVLDSSTLTNRGRQIQNWKWFGGVNLNDDLAVLVYTSGTTGKPKGAMLTHRGVIAALDMASDNLHVTSDDKFLAVLPLCHIYGLAIVMLGIFSRGGSLVLVEKFDPPTVLKLIESERISLIPAVPAMYQFLLMELEKNPYDVSSVRLCLSGAAPMPVPLFARLESALSCKVIEGYGLTESSSIVSINPVNGLQKHGSVGKPLKGIQVAIVSADGSHLPAGKENVGEVTVYAENVMRGYYQRPDATAETIKNGWLHTGDLGYLDEDGYLFIVGRTKEMIIRGGQNIYPREIEDVIARMPEVAEVAVIGVPDQFMGERVKAVVALRKGKTLTEDDVKAFCTEHLAVYKVPRLVDFVEALPRNSTGKVLKRLLQSPAS